jgi:hypothetical protein
MHRGNVLEQMEMHMKQKVSGVCKLVMPLFVKGKKTYLITAFKRLIL